MSHFEINFDAQKILVDKEWYTLEELGNQIKESISQGNYKIKKWSEASEQLQTILENSKKISFIIPAPLYHKYQELSDKKQIRLEILLKQALESYIAPNSNHHDRTEVTQPTTPNMNQMINDVKPEPKPVPKPEPKPAPNPEPKPAPNPESKPVPKPEPKPAPKPEEMNKPKIKDQSESIDIDFPIEEDMPIILEELVIQKKDQKSVSSEEKKQPPVIVDTKSGLTEDDWFTS